jgi:hypothetical protein
MARKIIPDSIRDVLHYDSSTGDLVWTVKRKKNVPHTPIRNKTGNGYYRLTYNNVTYMAHRVCWFLAHGEQADFIDHINGNGLDNRLRNLRNVDNSANQMNRKGVAKTYWRFLPERGRWYATSTYRTKRLYLGVNITTAWFRRIMAERADHPIALPSPYA